MDPPEPTSTKFKLWCWLLLLSVITVALGGLVWWKSRSERLQFVEPIWSDSLAGHETDAVTGQRRKIGEVWSLSRIGGFAWRDRGVSCHFEGRYPVFTSANRFQRALSEQLLADLHDLAASCTEYEWSEWWDCVKEPVTGNHRELVFANEVLFFSDRAVSLRTAWSTGGATSFRDLGVARSFVDQGDELHQVELSDLFHSSDWRSAITDICRTSLSYQGNMNDLEKFISFALFADGVKFHYGENEVLIPYEKLAEYLRPDGPHRLFQTKISE